LSALKTSQPVFDIDGGANRYLYQHTVDCDLGDGKITDFRNKLIGEFVILILTSGIEASHSNSHPKGLRARRAHQKRSMVWIASTRMNVLLELIVSLFPIAWCHQLLR